MIPGPKRRKVDLWAPGSDMVCASAAATPLLLGLCPSAQMPGSAPFDTKTTAGVNVRRWFRAIYREAPTLDDLYDFDNLCDLPTYKHIHLSAARRFWETTTYRVVVATGFAGRSLQTVCGWSGKEPPAWFVWLPVQYEGVTRMMVRVPHMSGRTREYNDPTMRRRLAVTLATGAYLASVIPPTG